MRKLIVAAALAGMGMNGPAQALGSANQTFDVNISLTAACQLSTITAVAFTYTAFQATPASSAGGAFTVTCSTGLAYTFGLTPSPGPAAPPGLASITVNDSFLLIDYTINAPAGGTGDGTAQAKTVAGTIAAGLQGSCTSTCNNSTATNKTHYLVVNY